MAAQLVNAATSEKFTEMDWTKSIEICELVAGDQRHAKDVIKAIKKRLEYKGSNTQLYAVTLLEMLMNNIGDHVHKQVIDTGLLSLLVKKVKQSDSPVREKIFLLLDATQTSLGGASAKFPQYYAAYYDLVSAGVQFLQNPRPALSNQSISEAKKNNPVSNGEPVASKHAAVMQQRADPAISESSIIQKAGAALGILREVLDAIDSQHPEEAKDEFTLDLVEQCSFEKQRVMHLVMTSWDEKVVSRAIELNDHLEKVLARHAELLLGKMTSTDNDVSVAEEEVEEEEGAEQLFRRRTKGKACAPPEEDEDRFAEQRFRLLDSTERPHRPLARPLSLDPSEQFRAPQPRVAIPPPPAKHAERERYFNENKAGDGSSVGGVAGLMRGLCLHGRNASSSSDGGRLTL